MIIARSPVRLSLLGGGTDVPNSIKKYAGMVVGGAIDKYSYITARYNPPFFEYKSKFIYSQIETVNSHNEIQHKAIAATLKGIDLPPDYGIEISHVSDIMSNSGTGSSSAFIASLINALTCLQNKPLLHDALVKKAIYVEQEILRENIGYQDIILSVYGGLNLVIFPKDCSFELYPLPFSTEKVKELEDHLLLFFTGMRRQSSTIAGTYYNNLEKESVKQRAMLKLVEDGLTAIYKSDYQALGRIINNTWQIKRSFAQDVSNIDIDRWHSIGVVSGSFGGKLTGAGSGGCLLFVTPPDRHKSVIDSLQAEGLIHIPFKFEFGGSRVIFVSRDQ